MLRGSNISRAIQVARADPALLFRAGVGKVRKLLPLPRSPHLGAVGQVRFEFDFSLSPTVSMMYRNTYQPEIQHALRKLLGPGDVFVDIGANIGYVSALALDRVGRSGTVLAIEPVPEYFSRLERMAELNPGLPLRLLQAAASDEDGTSTMELNRAGNIGMNSLVEGFVPTGEGGDRVAVSLVDLGRLLTREGISPDLIKIDVEGWEPKVLRSIRTFMDRGGGRPRILCEITPGAWVAQNESLDHFESAWRESGYEIRDPLTFRPVAGLDRNHQSDLLLQPA